MTKQKNPTMTKQRNPNRVRRLRLKILFEFIANQKEKYLV